MTEVQTDSDLDGGTLDVERGDVGQVVSRWVAVEGSSSSAWLWRQNHGGAGWGRSRRRRGRSWFLTQHGDKQKLHRGKSEERSNCWCVCVFIQLTTAVFTLMGRNSFAFGFNVEFFTCL